MPRPRCLPVPWYIEELTACFVVKDASGWPVNHFYFESEPLCRSAAGSVSRDEAWRAAMEIAKLPDLIKR